MCVCVSVSVSVCMCVYVWEERRLYRHIEERHDAKSCYVLD